MGLSLVAATSICILVAAFHLFLSVSLTNMQMYMMLVSFLGVFSIACMGDLIESEKLRNYLSNIFMLLALPCLGLYSSLLNPLNSLCGVYLTFTLFVFVLLVKPRHIFRYLSLAFIAATLLFYLENHEYLTSNYLKIYFFIFLFVYLVDHIIFSNKKMMLDTKERNIRDVTISLNHEVSTQIASLEVSLNKLQLLVDNETERRPKVVDVLKRCKTLIRNIAFINSLFANNFRDYFPKEKWAILNLSKVIDEALYDCRVPDNIKCEVDNSSEDFYVSFDEVILKNIIYNIIRNSIFFIQKANKGDIYLKLTKGKNENILLIRDTGYGIKKEYMPYIFDKFFSRRRSGTGMGLSFCRKAMKNFGGNIICDSEFGSFTEFKLFFPKCKE